MIVDLETILAEADGLLQGLRSGFVGDAPPPAPEPRMTPEQQQRLLAEIEDLRRQLAAAGSKPDDDAAA